MFVRLKDNYPAKQIDLIKTAGDKYSVKITDEQLESFKETFMMFDKDGDGTVSTKELGAVMRSLGNNPTQEELEELIDDADRDGSGSVDFREFVELMIKREAEKETIDDLKQVFRVFDKVTFNVMFFGHLGPFRVLFRAF